MELSGEVDDEDAEGVGSEGTCNDRSVHRSSTIPLALCTPVSLPLDEGSSIL